MTSHRVRVNVASVGGTPRAFLDASTAIRPIPRDEPSAELVPALTIAAHPSPARVGERLILRGLAAGQEVLLSRSAPEFLRPGPVTARPVSVMLPDDASVKPAMQLSSVVLPQPEAPSATTSSPRAMSRSTSCSASTGDACRAPA